MANQPERLKIGFVLDDSLDKSDGVQQYVLGLGSWLESAGHEVHYLVGQTSGVNPHVHSLAKNINVRFNGNRMSIPLPASKRAIRGLLAREQFDVLHVQMPYSPWLAHRIIRLASPKTAVVATFHIVAINQLVTRATKLLALWTRRSLARFDSIVSVSSAAAEYAKATYGVDSQVLPNVVDYQRFALAKPLLAKKPGITVLFLGRLVPRKGCRLLLEAIDLLVHDSKLNLAPFSVQICGRGPLEASLKQYVQAHNLGDIVSFSGFVTEEDKPAYYATADIAVFPSSGGESFGIVLLEAMSTGTAVVLAGDNSGYRSVLAERPELLFNAQDSRALATKLAEYLQNETARSQAIAWQKTYVQQFDVATVGAKLLELYKQALRKRQ